MRVRGDLIGDRPMAANHFFGFGDLVPTTATLVAILAISAVPLVAQEEPSAVQLKADAKNRDQNHQR